MKKINARKFKNVKFNNNEETVDVVDIKGNIIATLDVNRDLTLSDLEEVEEFAKTFVCDGKGNVSYARKTLGLKLLYVTLFTSNLVITADYGKRELTEEQKIREQGYTNEGLYNLVINSNIIDKITNSVPQKNKEMVDFIYEATIEQCSKNDCPNLSKIVSEIVDVMFNSGYNKEDAADILNLAKKIVNHEVDEKTLAESILEHREE